MMFFLTAYHPRATAENNPSSIVGPKWTTNSF